MKHIKVVIVLLIMTSLSSCGEDFLDPVPTSSISAENFYQNEEQLVAGIINMYDGLQGVNDTRSDSNHATQMEFYVTEMRSDNTRTKNGEGEAAQFDNFEVRPTNGLVADHYRSFYNVIFRANTVLANLSVASEENRAKFEAEAKFVRAYVYFNLVRLYGEVPLVDRVIGINDTDISYTRRSLTDVYDLIISDLEAAVEHLDNTYRNRASKAAAQALLAKVYLTLGTDHLEAQLLLEDVMASGYSLEPNFYDVFYNENNSEVIFSIGYVSGQADDSQNFSAEWLNGVGRTVGVNYVTNDAVEALNNLGGNRTDVSIRTDPVQPSQTQVTKYLPDGADGGANGRTFDFDARLAGNDWIVLRYADVLLMHVEAIMADGSETSVPAALNSFQLVRDRAGLTDPVTNITKQELLDERRVELAFENQRLFDLIRFGVAVETLSAFAAETGGSFSSTDLLLPIPQGEIGLSNGRLSQNPGY
ncbi:RagB/SusD family nutrient uptake outer membrane protein [Sungkyunkwania multivorans]|uniref:RagB/SusD family nutrient uptake outer membrane protein n=1 Tax=Sungkyunkwania multivorans TaxID=1173618 RepID=A0ABW3CWM6_9FLAO